MRQPQLNGGESPAYTLLDACNLIRLPYPVTERDLQRTAARIREEHVRTNLDGERVWENAIKAHRLSNLQLCYRAKVAASLTLDAREALAEALESFTLTSE